MTSLQREIIGNLQRDLDAFLARTGMSPSTFGKKALRDPGFVFALRAGRVPGLAVIDRVRAFISERVTND